MSVDPPGYRLLFIDGLEYDDLISLVAPIARTVVEDQRLWQFTGGIARRMRHFTQNDQRAKELLDFIHDRRHNPEILNIMLTVLRAQPDLNGFVRAEIGNFGGCMESPQVTAHPSEQKPEINSMIQEKEVTVNGSNFTSVGGDFTVVGGDFTVVQGDYHIHQHAMKWPISFTFLKTLRDGLRLAQKRYKNR